MQLLGAQVAGSQWSRSTCRGSMARPMPPFQTSGSRTVREYISVVLLLQICGR